APLYKNVKTAADEIIPIREGLNFYSDLLSLKPDAIHEMHQSGSSAKVLKAYSLFKKIPYTFHTHHFKGESKVKDQGKPKAAIQRDLDGVYAYWGQGLEPDFLKFPPVIKAKTSTKKRRIIIGAVATRETKMWPLQYVRQLSQLLIQAGFDVA